MFLDGFHVVFAIFLTVFYYFQPFFASLKSENVSDSDKGFWSITDSKIKENWKKYKKKYKKNVLFSSNSQNWNA